MGDIDLLTAGDQFNSNGVVWWSNNLCTGLIVQNNVQTICTDGFYVFGSDTLFTEGNYSAVYTTAGGCDSLVNLTLHIAHPDTTVALVNNTLVAASLTGSFQWINCADSTPIAGAVSNSFSPAISGDYAVQVEENGCTALSSCFTVNLCTVPIATNLSATICAGDSYSFEGQMLQDSGLYSVVLVASNGCDSTVNLQLSVINLEATVEVSGITLSAIPQSGVQFQWIDCQTNLPIAGATTAVFTPDSTGNYAVLLKDNNGCSALSDCFLVILSGTQNALTESTFHIWPNPVYNGILSIQGIKDLHDTNVSLWNTAGQWFKLPMIASDRLDASRILPGFYIVEITSGGVRYFCKVIIA